MLRARAKGEAGFPFVDARMRSLIATGWLNFHLRAMPVSFANYKLWRPVQETGLHLAHVHGRQARYSLAAYADAVRCNWYQRNSRR